MLNMCWNWSSGKNCKWLIEEAIGVIDETKPVKKAPVQQSQEPENPNKEEVEEAIIPEEEIEEAKGKDRAQLPILTF